jgi:hypothetical protein
VGPQLLCADEIGSVRRAGSAQGVSVNRNCAACVTLSMHAVCSVAAGYLGSVSRALSAHVGLTCMQLLLPGVICECISNSLVAALRVRWLVCAGTRLYGLRMSNLCDACEGKYDLLPVQHGQAVCSMCLCGSEGS